MEVRLIPKQTKQKKNMEIAKRKRTTKEEEKGKDDSGDQLSSLPAC